MALSRDIPAALLTEYQKRGFYPIAFIDLDWPSGRVRAHTNSGSIVWGGETWTGIGDFAVLSLPGDQAGMTSGDGTITIVGALDDLLVSNAETIKNRTARVWVGCTTTPGGTTLVSDPFLRFDGHMAGTKIPKATRNPRTGEAQHSLILTLGTGPGARVKATVRHSEEDQSTKFPGDEAGRHTALAGPNAAKLKWPE